MDILVRQRYAFDCGIAALSMVTGDAYEDVLKFFGLIDFSAHGLYSTQAKEYLVHRGYAMAGKYLYHGGVPSKLTEPWPPAPFAPIHLCDVLVSESAPVTHFVVMLRNGVVLDPLHDNDKRLTDYFRVNNVQGVFKVTQ